MELVLASQSQRRRELFKLIGLDFSVVVSNADENVPPMEPGKFVERLAREKAEQRTGPTIDDWLEKHGGT